VVENTAHTPCLVRGTQCIVFRLALVICSIGCTRAHVETPPVELSFDDQLSAVKAGHAEEINVSATAIGENDLAALAEVTALRVLLLDHPQSRITVIGIRHLAGLPNLQHLRIRGTGADNDVLEIIAGIKSLQILNLPRGEFTDAGLERLKELPKLVQLRFGSPHVTDAGMRTVKQLPELKRLHLIDVAISDAGLRELAEMTQLESLYIDGGKFSDEALAELFRARPDLHVHLNQQHHDHDPHKHAH
jgi:hypothetical protein